MKTFPAVIFAIMLTVSMVKPSLQKASGLAPDSSDDDRVEKLNNFLKALAKKAVKWWAKGALDVEEDIPKKLESIVLKKVDALYSLAHYISARVQGILRDLDNDNNVGHVVPKSSADAAPPADGADAAPPADGADAAPPADGAGGLPVPEPVPVLSTDNSAA